MSASHPLRKFLKHMRDEIWNRFHTGKFVYERDILNLRNFLKTAQKLGDTGLIVEYHLAISGIEHELGNFKFAEDSYTALLNLVLPLNDHWRIGVIYNNMAEIHLWQRDFATATTLYLRSVEHMQKTEQAAETSLIMCNTGMVYLAQQNYAEAEQWFRKVLDIAHGDSRAHLETLIQVYMGLADMYLQLKDYEKSLTHLGLAQEWAVGADFDVEKLEVFLIYAKLARQAPALVEHTPLHYYALAKSALTVPGRRYMVARVMLDEAAYHRENQEPAQARQIAAEAHKIFVEFGLSEYAKLAQGILDTLPELSPAPGSEKPPL